MNIASLPNPTLGMIIARIESHNNPQAMRFEPDMYARILPNVFTDPIIAHIKNIHDCSFHTATVIYSTSYGLYQIMGFNLFDPKGFNFTSSLIDFCDNPIKQDAAFAHFVIEKKINFLPTELCDDANRQKFALAYNGNPLYAISITESLQHFKVKACSA